MRINYEQDWPVYSLLMGVFAFYVYVVIHSKLQEKKNKGGNSK